MKTFVATPSTIKRDWLVIDADGLTLGRLATEVALRLRGKHKPEYTPFLDTGDYVIVINASKDKVTGELEYIDTSEHSDAVSEDAQNIKDILDGMQDLDIELPEITIPTEETPQTE